MDLQKSPTGLNIMNKRQKKKYYTKISKYWANIFSGYFKGTNKDWKELVTYKTNIQDENNGMSN